MRAASCVSTVATMPNRNSISPLIKRHMRKRSESVCEAKLNQHKQTADLEVAFLTTFKKSMYSRKAKVEADRGRKLSRPDNPVARKLAEEPVKAFTPLRRSKVVAQSSVV